MIWALRGAFILQALLGLGLSRALFGQRPLGAPSVEGDLHMTVGIIAAALALYVVRPAPGDTVGMLARFFPLVPLAVGLLVRFGGMGTVEAVVVHILLGIAAVGLIETYIARQRRHTRAATPSE